MPLDNSGTLTMRAAVEGNVARSEPVVEFARKKAPTATDTVGDSQALSSASEREAAPIRLADLPRISLPRDSDRPLVTANQRYAIEALEAYKGIRTRLLKLQAAEGFRSIAVASVGRSEGKTLTAFNLACCCAQVENNSVLLIDGDLRRRSLTKLMRDLPPLGLADVMSGAASCNEAIVRTDLRNLFVMGAGSANVSATELFSTERWNQVIRWAGQHFKTALVDGLSMVDFADFELIVPECDGVLMVVRARNTSREALKTAVEQLDPNKLVGVIWNGAEAPKRNGL